MCGIGGIQLRKSCEINISNEMRYMVECQRHRGPDDNGIYLSPDGAMGLCHNRLSILDLTTSGKQPMSSSNGRYVITYNGEIYNWKELRKSLDLAGVALKSRTDTEVLLELYVLHGDEILDRLRGMFAFAIFDTHTGSIFCARDRIGKKPFVFVELDWGVAFASEIPALRHLPGVDGDISPSSLLALFSRNFRHVPTPHTIYKSVHRLRPGHAMTIEAGRVVRMYQYWRPVLSGPEPDDEQVKSKIKESVVIRTEADVPIGCMLSGGVDSSAIAALSASASQPVHSTFSLARDRDDEDHIRAQLMAQHLGSDHHELFFDPENHLSAYKEILARFGEPVALLPLIYSYELCKKMKSRGVSVALSGIGADELYYGYTGYDRLLRISRMVEWLRPLSQLLSGKRLRLILDYFPANLRSLLMPPGQRKSTLYRSPSDVFLSYLSGDAKKELENYAAEELEYWGKSFCFSSYIDESSALALLVENAHSLAVSADLPGMLASVEVRAPFLDHELVEQAFRISHGRKLFKDGGHWQRKAILRRSVQEFLPKELVHAPKRGFGYGLQERDIFLDEWREELGEIFTQPNDLGGLLDRVNITQAWQDFVSGESVDGIDISRLVSLQLWAEEQRV